LDVSVTRGRPEKDLAASFFGRGLAPEQRSHKENKMAQETGTVKWFDARKGYGFIQRESGGDIFVHINDMADPTERPLEDGERVTFDVGQGRKGPAAQNVSRT
jgi:CspA family cold shock protein